VHENSFAAKLPTDSSGNAAPLAGAERAAVKSERSFAFFRDYLRWRPMLVTSQPHCEQVQPPNSICRMLWGLRILGSRAWQRGQARWWVAMRTKTTTNMLAKMAGMA
jgi:hypothetical protein